MLKQSLLSVFLVSVIFAAVVSCIGHYTIVAPTHIRPHSGYEVSLTLHDQPEPVTVLLSILDQNDTNFEIKEKIVLRSDHSELVSLPIGDLIVSHDYKFVAEGVEGLIFNNETGLKIESKNVSLFIQTDKAVYKPTDTIKFRVLTLDSLLHPVVLKKGALLDVFILDSEKNPVKQWKGVDTHKGVFVGELQLSDWSALGDWKIVAQVQKDRKTISIEVAEYVVPKFEVTIDAPTQFSHKDGKIRAIIRSKYTSGTFVKGKAIVSLTCRKPQTLFVTSLNAIRTIPVDGRGTVEFDTTDDLKLDFKVNACSYDCVLGATVIEELTGRNQSSSKKISVHLNRYKIVNRNDKRKFDAGLPLTFAFSIEHQDDSPILVNEETKEVVVAKTMPYLAPKFNEMGNFEFLLNSNGTVHVNIPTSHEERNFDLTVKYLGDKFFLGTFRQNFFLEPPHLLVKVLTERPTLNHDILVRVESKDKMQNFTYQLIANGKVLRAGKVTVPDRKFHEFQFKATLNMVPNLHLFVYRLVNGWIVHDHATTSISIEDELNNYVELKLSSVQAAPSSDVTITVSSNPNSYVGLLGVDQSSLLLKKNDGLTNEEALKEMGKYEYQLHARNPYSYDLLSRDLTLFEIDTNVILFTNAFQNVWRTFRADVDAREKVFDYDTDYVNGKWGHTREVRAVGESSKELESPRIRSEFPETWLWESIDIGTNGSALLQRKVPETITSWVISAFSIDPVTGLGWTKMPKTLKVFQPFSVSLNLPYSVKRGEIVAVPVVVFNYLEHNVTAELVIHNENNEYEFVNALGEVEKVAERKRIVQIEPNDGVAEWIPLRFNVVGSIPIKVTATSALAGDGIVRILQVEPEGVPVLVNKAVFVELREQNSFDSVQTVDVPENAVPGSIRINVNVAGDLIGEKTQYLHQLVRLRNELDGEKNLLRLVPNYVMLRYFKATGQLTHTIEQDAKRHLLIGLNHEKERKGSTWLTAFVVKSFVGASAYIDVDESVIEEALSWLNTTQEADGSFPELEPDAQEDRRSKKVTLTAYTATAFLTRPDPKYKNLVEKALDYVAVNVKEVDDSYALSVSAFALQKAKHPNADEILELLLSKSYVKGQLKWFISTYNQSSARPSETIDIEITSYGLLALMEADRLADGLPFFRWLLTQPYDRYDLGGFLGTQDAVIGLIALTSYARHLSTKDNNLELRIKTSQPEDIRINVDNEKALFLQTIELKPHDKSVQFLATGHGFALAQLSYSYYVNDSDASAPFILKPKLSRDSRAEHIRVNVCVTFKPTNDTKIHSTMVVLEVAMPSGYTTDEQSLNTLRSTKDVQLIETKRGETAVDIYIDNMTANEENCITVGGYRVHEVAEQKPAAVRIYDYYDSSRSALEFYTLPFITACGI